MKTLKDAFIKAHKENPSVPRPPTEEEFYSRHIIEVCTAFAPLTTTSAIQRFLRLFRTPSCFNDASDRFKAFAGHILFPPEHVTFFKATHGEYSYYVQAVAACYVSLTDRPRTGILLSYTRKKKGEPPVFHRVWLCHSTLEHRVVRP